MAVPWRAGQDWISKVRLTVSPENLPVTLEARACLDRRRSASVAPEKVPSGISTRFCIGTVVRACETEPDSWPRRLVRRTSHAPQRREPELPSPCTVQVPSASCARTGETPEIHTHPAMSRKSKGPRTTHFPFRPMIPTPKFKAPDPPGSVGFPSELPPLKAAGSRFARLECSLHGYITRLVHRLLRYSWPGLIIPRLCPASQSTGPS